MTTPNRDDDLARAFTIIAGSFANKSGVIDMLHTVVEECARVLTISDVGIVLADAESTLHAVAATSERTSFIELLQVKNSAGPCWRSYQTNAPLSIPNLTTATAEDARFRAAAHLHRLRSAYATPLKDFNHTIGALNLFASEPDAFSVEDQHIADAFARVATVALLRDRSQAAARIDRTQQALNARIAIERAKRLIAKASGISTQEAFLRIRSHAMTTQTPLADVAAAVLDNSLQL